MSVEFKGMFELKTVENTLSIEVKLPGKINLVFPIEYATGTRSRTEVVKEELFAVLNPFLDYKGNEFKLELYDALVVSDEIVEASSFNPSIEPQPLEALDGLLKLLDLDEMEEWIKKSGLVQVPSMLKTVYSDTMERNDEGSREQTYLKSDYFKLIAFINVLRVCLCPIGKYATVKSGVLPPIHKEYVLIHFITEREIAESEAYIKLKSYIEKLIGIVSESEAFSVKVIDKLIPKKEFSTYLLGLVIFQKFLLVNETIYVDDRNIITKLYNFIASKIGLKNIKTPNGVKIKSYHPTNVANLNEPESALEQYRVPSSVVVGNIEEFKDVFSDRRDLTTHLGINDHGLVEEIHSTFLGLNGKELPIDCIYIMSWIMKDIIDPRAIEYVEREGIINGLAVAYVYLIENDFAPIALLLSSRIESGDVMRISFSMKHKLSKEIKEEFTKSFPNEKTIDSKQGVSHSSFIEESITTIVSSLSGKTLNTVLTRKQMDKHHNGVAGVEVHDDIRNILGKLILTVARRGEEDSKS